MRLIVINQPSAPAIITNADECSVIHKLMKIYTNCNVATLSFM